MEQSGKKIYGISGEKGHGKDTLAKMIQKHDSRFVITHFAKDLKDFSATMWGLTEHQMYTEEGKDAPLPEAVVMDNYVNQMRELTGLAIQPAGMIAVSARQLLQFFGTEYVRKVDDQYWVKKVLARIEEIGDYILIPDTRFPNEAEAVRSVGGKVIQVQRVDLPRDENSKHASETSINSLNPDALYTFKTSEDALAEMDGVASFISRGKLLPEMDPRKQLSQKIFDLNEFLEAWEDEHNWGANIGVEYNPQTGRKKYFIMDMGLGMAGKPKSGDPRLAAAGHVVKEALDVAERLGSPAQGNSEVNPPSA